MVVIEVVAGFVSVDNAAAAVAEEIPSQGTEYEQGHSRHPDISVERMDDVLGLSS